MVEEYVVDVSAPIAGETEAVTARLARTLKLDEERVATLIRRLPDVVTRPISFDEATVVVERFSKAGLRARIRRVTVDSAGGQLGMPLGKPTVDLDSEAVLEQPAGSDDDLFLDTEFADDGLQEGLIVTPGQEDMPLPSLFDEAEPGSTADDPFELAEETESPADSDPDWPADPEPEPEISDPAVPAPRPLNSASHRENVFETFEEVTPAELQARLRGEQAEPASEPAGEPEPAAAVATATAAPAARKRRGSLRSKLLSTAIVPVLLTIVGALAATWYTARPALYQQLLDSARNPAIATAASLSSAFEQSAGAGGIDYLQLQDTILITRQAFPREDIAFIIATDVEGNPLPGFFAGGESLATDAGELQNVIRDRSLEAISLGTDARTGRQGSSSQLSGMGSGIEIVAQPLIVNQEPVGAVVVGVSDAAVTAQVNRSILNVLLFSLIPLLLAILIAVSRARRLTNNVLNLTGKADAISRGELDEEVSFRSGDELDDLAEALERMRVSMRGALDRLRRRR